MRLLEFVGHARPFRRRFCSLPAGSQGHAHALAVGTAFGRRALAVDIRDQAGDDFLFLFQQHAPHCLGGMRGEDRLDA